MSWSVSYTGTLDNTYTFTKQLAPNNYVIVVGPRAVAIIAAALLYRDGKQGIHIKKLSRERQMEIHRLPVLPKYTVSEAMKVIGTYGEEY